MRACICTCVNVCVCVYVCANMGTGILQRRGCRSSTIGITGSCGWPDVGAGTELLSLEQPLKCQVIFLSEV